MVMTAVLIAVAEAYQLPSRWLLCGALIASNLGGFSTRWGDTPNIIEAGIWGLTHADFFIEILPLNLIVLAGLCAAVTMLTLRTSATNGQGASDEAMALSYVRFKKEAAEFQLDRRLMAVGLITLAGFVTMQFVNRELEAAAGAAAILFAIAADRPENREKALAALDLQVFQVLLSVFVIAHCIRESAVGAGIESMIAATGGAAWSIALAGYFGTALSEAASWAAAAAPVTHSINPGHAGAWSLGAGIAAGSSSLLTAASAGIILWSESRRFPGHEINFRVYLPFGLAASVLMLAFYIAAISATAMLGGFGS
jgi:Na+/H+ antiporter NhaD/arsenite permease-like protein